MADPPMNELDPRKRRRLITAGLLRSFLTATVLVALYYALPAEGNWRLSVGVHVVVGLVVLAAVITWQTGDPQGDVPRYSGDRGASGHGAVLPVVLCQHVLRDVQEQPGDL
jgi:hypothetical protein